MNNNKASIALITNDFSVYYSMIKALPQLIRRSGIGRRARIHFTVKRIHKHGFQEWSLNGLRHREDGGPACISRNKTLKWWYFCGKQHRVNGPAVIYPDGYESWYLNGKRHRVNGPSVTHTNGSQQWYLHGERQIKK